MHRLIKIIVLLLLLVTSPYSFSGKFDYVVSDIPLLYDYLDQRRISGSWGAFAPEKMPDGYVFPINIQFSVENGVVGLDWPLSSPANIQDRAAFEKFAKKENVKLTFITASNGFEYLRCEGSSVRDLPVRFLKEFYGFKDSDSVFYFSGGY